MSLCMLARPFTPDPAARRNAWRRVDISNLAIVGVKPGERFNLIGFPIELQFLCGRIDNNYFYIISMAQVGNSEAGVSGRWSGDSL